MIDYNGFNIHIFMDASLMADELANIAIRTEKKQIQRQNIKKKRK